MKPKVAGIVWYKSSEDYHKVLLIMEDAFKLPDTYEDFLKRFGESVAFAEMNGMIPVKAELDPETFPAWCKARSLNVDATGRETYANFVAYEYLRDNGML